MNGVLRALVIGAIASLVMACSGSTSGASPTPLPVAPTADDLAAGFKIAAPYALAALSPAQEANFQKLRDRRPVGFRVGGRQILQDGVPVGIVEVIGLSPSSPDADFQNALSGLGAGAPLASSTILGTTIWSGSTTGEATVIYRTGDTVIAVVSKDPKVTLALVRALLAPNG